MIATKTRTRMIATPDAAFAARPRLLRLRDAFRTTPPPRLSRWGEPAVFFFDPVRQAELLASRPASTSPHSVLEAMIRAELPALLASVEVRRMARAIPGLRQVVVASKLPAAQELATLLTIPDDETFLVLHPATRSGYRLTVRGVVDAAQFQMLMLDQIPGVPPPPRLVAAYREADAELSVGAPLIATTRFQLFHTSAVQPDGTVPTGFRGSDHWLWPHQPLANVARVDGERVVLLGDPAFRASWEVERRFATMPAEVRLMQQLTPVQVADRLGRLVGRPIPAQAVEREPLRLRAA